MMVDGNKDKSTKKNKVQVSDGASDTSRASRRSTTKDTASSKGGKRKAHSRKKDKAHVAKATSESVTPPSQVSAEKDSGSCRADKDEYESKIGVKELVVKSAAQVADNVEGLVSNDDAGSSVKGAAKEYQNQPGTKIKDVMFDAAFQAAEAMHLGAKDVGASNGKGDKRRPKTKTKELMLEAALQAAETVALGASGAASSKGERDKRKPKTKIKELMLEAAVQTAQALDVGAKDIAASKAVKGRRKSKKKTTAQVAESAAEMAVASEVLSAKNSELSIADTHGSNSKKRNKEKPFKAMSESAASSHALALNDTILSVAGTKPTQRIVEDCTSVESKVPSSKPRSPMQDSSGSSDESIQEFLPVGNCVNTDHQKAFAEVIRRFVQDVPNGKVILRRLKRNVDPVLLSHPSVASNDSCMCALLLQMMELGIKVGQKRLPVLRIGARLLNMNNPQARPVLEQFRSLIGGKGAHPLGEFSNVHGGEMGRSLKDGGNRSVSKRSNGKNKWKVNMSFGH